MPKLTAVLSDFSSWSVTSISISRVIVSSGDPSRCKASALSPPSPDFYAWSLYMMVSGLYFPRIAHLMKQGKPGNLVIAIFDDARIRQVRWRNAAGYYIVLL